MACSEMRMRASREMRFYIVLVTAPNVKTARKIARLAVSEKAAACASLAPGVESYYWWQGKMDQSEEVLILFKTTGDALGRLEKLVMDNHPYDTPEFLALRISKGNRRYLEWCRSSLR
jgi:periplasmic divalent cation tolerance protein